MSVKYVLFDMDGLLLDTETIYTEVSVDICRKYGKVFDWELKAKMMGLREKDAGELIVKTLDLPISAEEYLRQRYLGHEALFPFTKPLPGVLKLVKHLKKHNIPICVATSSYKKAYDLKIKNNQELFSLFEEKVICGDDKDITNGKPYPDIFLAAARKLGKTINAMDENRDCLVFEDAPSGVLAGLNAKMRVCWIPDKKLKLDEQLTGLVDSVIFSMEDFVPENFGLPKFDD
ncbi:Pseudouridine-5'-phosphatase [Clydaea vesicula]|uniref:Pseudouridine-5'-phosphatase n=1 Tax=Clydaea vesicula TaxID=447962 RepID=A0AAD5U8J3_9FUNG|nr:Pseudouridine-5'-phosphatase [Clydaea vesicula]KAJ3397033.1 Pseudouridine-5'-phosphatase [Lobulomyces angularis]